MPLNPPVPYTPDVEATRPDEAETIGKLDTAFRDILDTTSKDYGHAVRAVHAKAHAILEGTLTVEPGLPPEFAQGLFVTPGAHRLYMRMSTNAGDVLPDAIGLPRGLAIKVLDVPGERLAGAEGATQDFILINSPIFTAKRADQFLSNLKLLARTTDRATGAKVVLSKALQGVESALEAVGLKSGMVTQMGGAPNVDPLGETYWTATPFRYGDYIAKFQIAPVSPGLTALSGRTIDIDGRDNAIRETVQTEMPDIEGVWELRAQLCRDLEAQPVEDPTVEWKEEETPFVRVATLRVAPQDSWDGARVDAVDERMRFSIWTGLAAHRPLGDVNRARRETYRHSAEFRASFNGCPMHEPRSA